MTADDGNLDNGNPQFQTEPIKERVDRGGAGVKGTGEERVGEEGRG